MSDIWARVQNDDNRWLLNMHNFWGATDNNGNLQAVNEAYGAQVPVGSLSYFRQDYTHDTLNRLSSVSDAGYARTFNYDRYGNMWVSNASGIAATGPTSLGAYDAGTNRLSGQSYDAAGNQLVVNGNTLTYDAESRLTSATAPVGLGGGTAAYYYDGNGQRVAKNGAVPTSVYVYDAFGQLAAEYSTAGNNPTCSTCYPVWDHLGTPRLVTDQNGNIVARHDYLPFGEEIATNTAGRNSQWGPLKDNIAQKFTGQERDSETGLDFFQARYFGGALGRFTSPDPMNAGADLRIRRVGMRMRMFGTIR